MTTGSAGDSTASWQPGTYDVPYRFTKTWFGTDGKHEVYAGGLRSKWNPYTSRSDSRLILTASIQRKRRNGTTFTTATYTCPGRLPDVNSFPLSSAEQNRLIDKMLTEVRGHSFNLAVNLGEMRQTVGLLSSTLESLGRSILAVKRGRFQDAVRALGVSSPKQKLFKTTDVSGRWLEIQYGWKPLLSDSYEACKAFESISKGPRTSLFVKSYGKKIVFENSSALGELHYMLKGTRFRRLEFELYEEMSVPRQLGMLDPLSVAWELLPYSFVVDWFVPFGTYLSNLNQVPSLKGRWLITDVSKWPRQEMACNFSGAQNTGSQFDVVELLRAYRIWYRSTSMIRTVGVPPVVRPEFDFRGLFHGVHLQNALALAYQRFRR